MSSEKAALFLLPEKFARKYDVPGIIKKYNEMENEIDLKILIISMKINFNIFSLYENYLLI